MRIKALLSFLLLIVIFSSSCQVAPTPETTPSPTAVTPAANFIPTGTPTKEPLPIPEPVLSSEKAFEKDSPLCPESEDPGTFSVLCSNGDLVIRQAPERKARKINWYREIPTDGLEHIQIKATILSIPAEGVPIDENQYGLFYKVGQNTFHALRIMNQYFSFQKWFGQEEIRVEERTNFSFSPFLNPAEQENTVQLDCSRQICDLSINTEFAGRISMGTANGVSAVGIFASSDWDQQFGEVHFEYFQITSNENKDPDKEPYSLSDLLKGVSDIFSKAGLSGAFSDFEEDGFHFSPVIPSANYEAKTGPSLADMSVEVTVITEINPEKNTGRFGGLICRSSLEGMYMAVIRADSTFSVYSDTPKFPLTPRMEGKSEAINHGTQENRLRLDCIGNQIDFYINEELVASFTDNRFDINFGRGGLFTKAGGQPDPDAIIFRDFSIREIR